MLDGCGIIEGLGTPCDIANGFFYAIEGNGTDATLSFAAGLPGGAIINGGRLLKKAVNIGGKTRRFVWREVGGLVGFSHGSSYRTVWKAVYPALDNVDMRAHHVVPKALWDNALVQKAARANPNGLPDGVDPFHMNMPANGWPVHTSRHAGNHQGYSDEILAKLTEWDNLHPDATSEQAATAIAQWQILIKNTIGNSATGPNINNLDLPDIP